MIILVISFPHIKTTFISLGFPVPKEPGLDFVYNLFAKLLFVVAIGRQLF